MRQFLEKKSMHLTQRLGLGLQHTVAMFGATVLMPLLTGLDPSVALFSAGIGTLIFHFLTRRIVPVFLGSSFAFIAPILLAEKSGASLADIGGAILVAGALYLVFAFLAKMLGAHRIKKIFPAIVTGPIIIVIGLSLAPVAVKMASEQWMYAVVTLLAAIITALWCRGIFKMFPILIGVLVGYGFAYFKGDVNAALLTQAHWFGMPRFTICRFNLDAILFIAPVALVTFMEHIGDIMTNGRVVGKDFFEHPGLQRTLLGDGVATMLSGFLGGPTLTTYAENTGVLAVTGVYDPSILRIAAVFAMILGFSPKIAALLHSIPHSILGGISMLLFGMIASIGIRTLAEAKIDFAHTRNLMIVSIILVLGLSNITVKMAMFQMSSLALATIVGILLNICLPKNSYDYLHTA